LLIVKGLH